MKKLLPCSIFLVPLFLSQCSSTNDNPVTVNGDQTKTVEIAITIPPGLDTLVDRAVVRVTGEGMNMMETELSIDSTSISGKIRRIPVGLSRQFEVVVYDINGDESFRGTKYADVNRGITYVNIALFKVADGTAIVNGTFDDSSMYTPFEMYHLINVIERDKEKKIVVAFMSASAMVPAGWNSSETYPFEYSWYAIDADDHSVIDTMRMEWNSQPMAQVLTFPWDANIKVVLSARYSAHPEIARVDTIVIEVKDGWVTDLDKEPTILTDTTWMDLAPDDTENISLHSQKDTIRIVATGTWCMGTDICSSAGGDCDLDKNKFYESDYCGSELLARCGDKLYEIGTQGAIVNAADDFQVTLFANRLKNPRNESGKIKLIITHTHP
jgi:hypothetical protein